MSTDSLASDLRKKESQDMKDQLAEDRRQDDINKIIRICFMDINSMVDVIRNEVDESFVRAIFLHLQGRPKTDLIAISLNDMAERFAKSITANKDYSEGLC